jgi:hypothetical protein
MKSIEFIACMAVICLILAPFIGLGLFIYKQTKEAILKAWDEL